MKYVFRGITLYLRLKDTELHTGEVRISYPSTEIPDDVFCYRIEANEAVLRQGTVFNRENTLDGMLFVLDQAIEEYVGFYRPEQWKGKGYTYDKDAVKTAFEAIVQVKKVE